MIGWLATSGENPIFLNLEIMHHTMVCWSPGALKWPCKVSQTDGFLSKAQKSNPVVFTMFVSNKQYNLRNWLID